MTLTVRHAFISAVADDAASAAAGKVVPSQWNADHVITGVADVAVVQGRLTLSTGVPIYLGSVSGATSIYFTPFNGNCISLWDGSAWKTITFTEYTLAVGTLTSAKPYDVFAYLNAGALALEVLVWTSDNVRATAITLQDGRYAKSGDKTRLYIGTFYTTSTTTTEDSITKRFLYNYYNRVPKALQKNAGSTAHTYASSTYREYNNSTTDVRVQWVDGIADAVVSLSGIGNVSSGVTGNGTTLAIAINSVTASARDFIWYQTSNSYVPFAALATNPQVGLNYGTLLEKTIAGTGSYDFAGTQGTVYV